MRRSLLLVCSMTVGSLTACGGSDGDGGDGLGEDVGTDGTTLDGTGGGDSDAPFNLDTGGGSSCTTAAECDGGVCVDGICCSSAASVCSGKCCGGGTVCLFDKCVTPGGSCFTSNDCKPGQYCETALGATPGGGDAGVDAGPEVLADGGAPGCFEPAPRPGKCLDLPPICPGSGGDAGVDSGETGPAGCIDRCEYRPKVAKLDAVAKWSWGLAGAREFPGFIDVWATPTVGRVYDSNCDGKVNELDPPQVIFVSGNAEGTCCQCNGKTPTSCHTGVLRMLDGKTGKEVWSLRKASTASAGFAGLSVAIGDLDGDARMDIVAVTGEGDVVAIDSTGKVTRTSDTKIPGNAGDAFGWGGGLAIADMDADGFPEVAYGGTVYTTKGGGLKQMFSKTVSSPTTVLSTFVDLDGAADGLLELLVGSVAYKVDGTALWNRTDLAGDGFPAVGDFDKDGKPEVAYTYGGNVVILEGATGVTELGPVALPGTGSGGPPTIADFDGDGKAEIGVAMATFYSVMKPNYAATPKTISVLWKTPNHDLSSSVTGSSVFDFEGDGRAEVIYNDECFLWVYDGVTGAVRYAALTTSFTATEASLVADVDGDGRSEIVMVSNGADPSAAGWKCDTAPWNTPDPVTGRPAWKPPTGAAAYRGITLLGDKANAWVGTRTLWNEHTYHVSNVCDDRDSACGAPNIYGSIPKNEKKNWTLTWLNNFRQNVQDKGIFDAPDATVSLTVQCTTPVTLEVALRNAGLASLPAGVEVGVYKVAGAVRTLLGKVTSTHALFPGQTERLSFATTPGTATKDDTFIAKVLIDPLKPTFRECREDNDESAPATATCPK
ncbi:MAG: VCBS repeat-containing protein [Polyangiales bacterium]